jgi:hypothetical protein
MLKAKALETAAKYSKKRNLHKTVHTYTHTRTHTKTELGNFFLNILFTHTLMQTVYFPFSLQTK